MESPTIIGPVTGVLVGQMPINTERQTRSYVDVSTDNPATFEGRFLVEIDRASSSSSGAPAAQAQFRERV